MLLPHGHAHGYPGLLWYPKEFGKPNQNPDLGILFPNGPIDPGIQSIPTQIIGWIRNLPKSGLFGKIQKLAANLWSRNVKIQHGLLGEPGRNPNKLRNCTPKKWAYMIQECQSNTDWAIIRSAIHLLSKIRFHKKQAPPFSNGSQFWLFLAKKEAKLLAQGPGRKKSRYRKKTCQIRVDTVSFLCILLVPKALPKRERSLWLPPQNVLRQGWLGHYYKSFPDNKDQVFLR